MFGHNYLGGTISDFIIDLFFNWTLSSLQYWDKIVWRTVELCCRIIPVHLYLLKL